MFEVNVVLEDPELMPKYALSEDAGADLRIKTDICLAPLEQQLVGTGVRVLIPEGYFGLMVPRSSMGKLKISLANTVGIIDSGYTGELRLFLRNNDMENSIFLEEGSRVAQLILVPFVRANFVKVTSLDNTQRGENGFGHSGA